jgi:hypothetical protein
VELPRVAAPGSSLSRAAIDKLMIAYLATTCLDFRDKVRERI